MKKKKKKNTRRKKKKKKSELESITKNEKKIRH